MKQPGEDNKPAYECGYCEMDYGGLRLWLYATTHGDKIGNEQYSAGLYPDHLAHTDDSHIMALQSKGPEAWVITQNRFAAWLVRGR